RASFVVFMHRAMIQNGSIEQLPAIVFTAPVTFGQYEPTRYEQQFIEVPIATSTKTYLRSNYAMRFAGEKTVQHAHAKDIVYTYNVAGLSPATVTLAKRELQNGDYSLVPDLRNAQRMTITVGIVQAEAGLEKVVLQEYSRYPIKKNVDET